MAAVTLAEPLAAVNPTTHLVCDFCQASAPEHLIPLQGKHVHACPGFVYHGQRQPGDYDAYFDGRFIIARPTRRAAEALLDSYVYGLLEDGLLVEPAVELGIATLELTLGDFDYPNAVTHRSVSVAELEQAAQVLGRQQPTNTRLHQLAAEVIATHGAGQLAFRYRGGLLEVTSWSSGGRLHICHAISGCIECEDAGHDPFLNLHSALYELLGIRERGMVALVRRERHGGYSYDQVAA